MASTPARQAARLAICLLLSSGLHVSVLNFSTRHPAQPTLASNQPKWLDRPLQLVDLAPRPPVQLRSKRIPVAVRSVRPDLSASALPTAVAEQAAASTAEVNKTLPAPRDSAPPPSPQPRLDIAALLLSARAIAREEQARESPPFGGIARPQDRPVLPALDRALKREPPGEHYLGGGLTRVVTTSGRVYCLQAPPDFARGGPVEALAVPTNCP